MLRLMLLKGPQVQRRVGLIPLVVGHIHMGVGHTPLEVGHITLGVGHTPLAAGHMLPPQA